MNRELESWQERNVKPMRIEDMIDRAIEFEQEEARKQRRREIVMEAIGATVLMIGVAVLAWLFLAMTPNQRSAEAEALAEELEATSGK